MNEDASRYGGGPSLPCTADRGRSLGRHDPSIIVGIPPHAAAGSPLRSSLHRNRRRRQTRWICGSYGYMRFKTPNVSIFFLWRGSVNTTHDMGIIFKYRLGKGTSARLTCRRVKVSGTLSSFRVAERTSVMRSLVRPTQILNSFMLHGCSKHLSRSGMGGGYLELKTDVCGAAERTT